MKLKNKKGFTLMEMLIVVAIIAVLIAIAIPTMNNALEKSREAVDEANIRSLYAEAYAAVLTEDKSPATNIKDATLKCEADPDNADVLVATATYKMTQHKDGTASGNALNIGGVEITSDKFTTGTATIIVKSNGDKPTITIAKG